MLTFAQWFEEVWQRKAEGEGRSAAIERLHRESDVSMPSIWRGLRGSRLTGETVAKLLKVAGAGAFDGLALVTAEHVAPGPRGRRQKRPSDGETNGSLPATGTDPAE